MGALDITLHSTGGVVPAAKEFDGVHEGLLDIGNSCTTYWVDKFGPVANLFTYTIGGLSPAESMLWHMVEGTDLLRQLTAEYNVEYMDGCTLAPEMFLAMKVPLNSLADLKGKKIRTTGDDGVCLSRMGATVVFLSGAELMEAALRGIIDGFQWGSPCSDYSIATYDVIKYNYLSPARQPTEWMAVMFNKKTWAELPDGLKVMITEMTKGMAWNQYKEITQMDIVAIEKFKEKGVTMAPIPQDIELELARQAEILYAENSAKDPFYKQVYDSIRKFREAYREGWPRL